MNDVVKLLPDSVANQIAAGEVIQRPASVVKELVENAVDAGASIIKITIKDAGRTLIQVVDNGCGMSPTDARLAFDRHSTSKINDANDLFSLKTMGFRGEALASICAVSEVELRTRRKDSDDPLGSCIVISGSKVESQEPVACAAGSCMMVKRLFFNVPARRKFLKSDSVEMSHILREFERLALVNPEVEFQLTHNDTLVHQLMRGSFKQRIVDLFGKSLDHQLVPIKSATSLVTINGFVCRPENARRRGALQYFMVNGRNMRHPYFHKAVMMCYDQLISADAQPSYFINFTVDPETIDVNIHPTKNEIKFENEQPIWQIITATVKEALGKFNAVPSIDFDTADAPEIPVFSPDGSARHEVDMDTSYNPFVSATPSRTSNSRISPTEQSWQRNGIRSAINNWEKLYEDFTGGQDNCELQPDKPLASISSHLNESAGDDGQGCFDVDDSAVSIMQLKGRYLLTPAVNGLNIIDQHRAHICILYYRYMQMAAQNPLPTQRIIFPEIINLSASDSTLLESVLEDAAHLGFDISYLGNGAWSANGLPAVVGDASAAELIEGMIASVSETGQETGDALRSKIALSMANAAAIKPGQRLTAAEMEQLVSDLSCLPLSRYTPDGRAVVSVVTNDDIARLFV
ncbi:DNA mismatch repair endonuclease MutL [uncultured Muribaculum sp.]|uniref:DNA mismatch repair endonuclease MutL n=1 Tax=uncultured Muribaculum sp. TaxID=1918613 RepID=UPI0025A974CC|nr:DNA mismatch repair endonuclease MutL [uncultured Muribaculum sp.]